MTWVKLVAGPFSRTGFLSSQALPPESFDDVGAGAPPSACCFDAEEWELGQPGTDTRQEYPPNHCPVSCQTLALSPKSLQHDLASQDSSASTSPSFIQR